MRILEFLSWLAYACWGFLFLTLFVFLMGARSILEEKSEGVVLHFLQVEFLAAVSILLFCSTLQWCVDKGPVDRRMKRLKFSAFLVSIMVIMMGGGLIFGVDGVLYSREFLSSFFAVMSPSLVSMSCSFLRARGQSSALDCDLGHQVVKFERAYLSIVFLLVFTAWNLLCFYPD